MGINKAKEIIHEAKIKIMEMPYFEEKVDVISALLDLEFKLMETERETNLPEEDFSNGWEQPWND